MAPYATRKPKFSDHTIDLVRSAAHRHVRAGGSIFPVDHDDDADGHTANVRAWIGADGDAFEQALHALNLPFEARERLWSTVWSMISDYDEAAFLFGGFVGLELAALNGSAVVIPKQKPTKKGGAR